jgi:polar amino acid transport system substrate-binding protein
MVVPPPPDSTLVAKGTLTVGVSDANNTSPPETYNNNGSVAGFDIDLITAIARAMNLKPSIKETPTAQLLDNLNGKQFDVVISAYLLTDQIRTDRLNVPYLAPKDVLLVPKGNPGHLNFNVSTDLCGHTIGVQDTTYELDVLNGANSFCPPGAGKIKIMSQLDAETAANALIQNKVEAIYQNTPTVSYYRHQFPGKFELVGKPVPMPQGILIQKDNQAVQTAIQNAFNSLVQNGKYRQLLNTQVGDLSGDAVPAS